MTADASLPEDWKQLVTAARAAREQAYAPYSNYLVGATIRTQDGQIFSGCNVENASYGLTICAERSAMCSAVAAGSRQPDVICISLAGEPSPCGSCRQFLHEFNPELIILLDNCNTDEPPELIQLKDLLPRGFNLQNDGQLSMGEGP